MEKYNGMTSVRMDKWLLGSQILSRTRSLAGKGRCELGRGSIQRPDCQAARDVKIGDMVRG